MLGAAALPMVRGAAAQARPRNIVISSANGVAACAKAMEVLKAGGDTLDAVIAGVNIVELDPNDTSVGYGGLPNEDGVVELDASCMHGPTRRGGAVGAIRGIKTPSKIAQLVMSETDHMMLVGEGALRFAKACGFPEEDLLTDKSRLAWRMWKREMRDLTGHSNWESGIDGPPKPGKMAELKKAFPGFDEETLAWAYEVATNPPHGTINCMALNEKGEMSAVTTTSGLAWKIPGRVGDSPIIGAGLYVDGEVGAAGSTGRGEANLFSLGSFLIVESLRNGLSPKDAGMAALKRVVANTVEKRLLNSRGSPNFNVSYYILNRAGAHAGVSLYESSGKQPARYAICAEDGPRTLPMEPLFAGTPES